MDTEATSLPPGYRLRAAIRADLPGVLAVVEAGELADHGVSEASEEEVAEAWARPRFDLAADAWVIEAPDGAVAGYVDIWDSDPHVDFDVDAWVDPGHPRQLQVALLDAAARRAREHLPHAPPGARVVLHTVSSGNDTEGNALLQRLGWAHVRTYLRMAIDLGETVAQPVWPDGLTVRSLRRGIDDAAAHRASEEAFAQHFRHPPVSLEEFRGRHLGESFTEGLSFLVWDSDECAAVLLGLADEGKGWIRELGVRPGWRGRGVGKAMLQEAFRRFCHQGLGRVELGVDQDNASQAVRLYEQAGMHPERIYHFYAYPLRPPP